MPQITCPDCRAVLKVRDDLTGTVRCPKCSAPITLAEDIPVVGAPDEPPAPRVPRPALKHSVSEKPGGARGAVPPPAVSSAPPRRPRREEARPSSGPNTVLIILGVVAVLFVLMCAGGGIVGYLMWDYGPKSTKNFVSGPAIPTRSGGGLFPNAPPVRPDGGGAARPRPGFPPDFPGGFNDPFGGNAKPVKLPDLPPAIPIGVAPLPGEKHVIDLPDRVVRVASGGGGRFMVLAFGGEKKVGVFDLNDLKIHYVDVPNDDVWVAAGMNCFTVLLPGTNKLRRYNLLDRKLEKERDLEVPPVLTSFGMGSASNGPLLIVAGQELSRECRFFDLDSLQPMDIPAKDIFSRPADAQNLYWPAANGRYFGCCWANDGGGLKLSGMSIESGIIERVGGHSHTWFVAPFADGKHVATGGSGILSRDCTPVDNVPMSAEQGINLTHMFVPAQSGQFYMHVQTGIGHGDRGGLENKAGTIVFYALGNREPLLTLQNVPVPRNEWPEREELVKYQSITLPRGVHFSPEAKTLVVIPATRDKLHLYRVDLKKKN